MGAYSGLNKDIVMPDLPSTPRYITTVAPVRDVRLVGIGNLTFWQQYLHVLPLVPYALNGTAHVIISSTDFVWQRIPVQEFVLSLVVALPHDPTTPAGFYLVHAFNSSRLLALIERVFFQTPYTHGQTQNTAAPPASITLTTAQRTLLQALMSPNAVPQRHTDEPWEGRIFLPVRAPGKQRAQPYFFAKFTGACAIYPWTAADTLTFLPDQDDPVCACLQASHFQATEWRVHNNASHARSKTYTMPW